MQKICGLGLLTLIFSVIASCGTGLPKNSRSSVVYTVSTQYNGELITVPVSLNGAIARPFILDSGAADTLISESYRREINAPPVGKSTLKGIGKAVLPVDVIQNIVINVSGLQWAKRRAIVTPDSLSTRLTALTGQPFHGILGGDLFSQYVVAVDYQQQQLKLFAPKNFRYTGTGDIVPMQVRQGKPYIKATLIWPSKQTSTGSLLLDLGSREHLDITGTSVQQNEDWFKAAKPRIAAGVGGNEKTLVDRVSELRFGQQVIPNPITASTQSSVKAPLAGRIGNQILARYTVIFDYSRQRVIFEPKNNIRDSFETDMSGLRLAATGKNFRQIEVIHVYANSPASQQGIQKGDRLLAIDGQASDSLSLARIRRYFIDRPGVIRQLKIQRGSKILTIQLSLSQLI